MFSFFNNFLVSKPLQKRTRPNGKRVFFRPKRNDIACLLLVRSRNHCGAPKRNAAYNKTISQSAAVVFILFLILFSFLNVHNHLIRGVEQPLPDAGSRTHVHLMVLCCCVAVEPRCTWAYNKMSFNYIVTGDCVDVKHQTGRCWLSSNFG